MKCSECKCILSPEEVDEILTDLVDGLKPSRICEDCKDFLGRNAEEDFGDEKDY